MTIHVSKEEHDAVAAYVEGTLSPLITMLLVKQLSMAAVFLREEIAKTAAQPLKAEQAKDAAEDAELLDWLEAMTDKGYCPAVVFDDDGHWAVLFDGIQSTPGDGPLTSSFIAGTETAWHDSIRAAIRAARAAERKA